MEKIGNTDRAREHRNIILEGFDPVSRGGFTQVADIILINEKLSLGAKLTYSMLLRYAWQNDFCYPGQDTLGKAIGITDRQVRRHLTELIKIGYVSVHRRGLGKTNVYTLYATIKKRG